MLGQLALAPINHVLRGESWALRRLQPFAGRTVKIQTLPFQITFTVTDSGEVAQALPNVEADATFRFSPAVALRILGRDESAFRDVAVSGDADFAQAIEFVIRHARWDAEEDLARVFGDIAAHRITAGAREVMRLQARAAQSLAHNLADYLVEERAIIVRRREIEAFVREVDTLRDDAERLAQRISRLASPSP